MKPESKLKSAQDIKIEMYKVDLWLTTAQKQFAAYKDPADREASEFVRYDYYLQSAAREASFALEHLLRSIHFFYQKHPEPSFQMTEILLADANRFLEKAGEGEKRLEIKAIEVLRAAIANDEDINADIKIDKTELGLYLESIARAYEQSKILLGL